MSENAPLNLQIKYLSYQVVEAQLCCIINDDFMETLKNQVACYRMNFLSLYFLYLFEVGDRRHTKDSIWISF